MIATAHVASLLFLRRRSMARYARPLAVGLNLITTGGLLYLLSLSPNDLDVLAGPVSAMLLGCALLYPWGTAPQLVFALATTAGYLAVAWPHIATDGMRAGNTALGIGVCAIVSVIGAAVLERSRREAFRDRQRVRRLAVQRRRLLDVGRELRSTLHRDSILSHLLEHARGLVPSDALTLIVRDAESGVHRMVAATGDSSLQSFLGVPVDEAIATALHLHFAPADVREFPGTPFDDAMTPSMQAFGYPRGLCAVIGSHPKELGYVTWLRRADRPFSPNERLAALGMADQAHTALSAAALFEEAERLSRLKSEFVSTMSHELRTPLNVIMGYAQILTELLPPDPETTRALGAVQRASHELLDLIDATLDLGRLESVQGRTLDERPVDLRELFEELAAEFAPVPRAAGLTLSWDAADGPPLVTDRRKLRIVIKNLVGNALKFTPAGAVRIEARPRDDRWRLRVIDTGIGIRPEDQSIVWDMFRQADSSDSRRFGGTGLGLYIVRRLVDVLDGEVHLESAPGCGSTFTLSLPLTRSTTARAAA